MAFQMLAAIALFTYIGIKLDERYQSSNSLITVGFALMGVAVAMISVIWSVVKDSKKD